MLLGEKTSQKIARDKKNKISENLLTFFLRRSFSFSFSLVVS